MPQKMFRLTAKTCNVCGAPVAVLSICPACMERFGRLTLDIFSRDIRGGEAEAKPALPVLPGEPAQNR